MEMEALSPSGSPFSGNFANEEVIYGTPHSVVGGIPGTLEDSPLKRKRPEEPEEPSVAARRNRQRDHDLSQESTRLSVLEKILRERFQHNSFRYEQEAALLSVINGNNTLVVFPTGAGKSLCFQVCADYVPPMFIKRGVLIKDKLPAVAFEQLDGDMRRGKHGITVVISPLLSLIKDQVDALKRKGIPTGALDSTQTVEEQLETYRAFDEGELKLLYCNPEKLNTKGFVRRLKRVPGGVRLVAVDEAHCVSEWGHSFRPDYLKVARFVKQVAAERVVCLTATATTTVVGGICDAFDIKTENVFRLSPYRENLELRVESTKTIAEKVSKTLKYVESNPGPTVVYAAFIKDVDNITRRLKEAGHKAEAFYAKIPTEKKRQVQEGFMSGEIRIVCATIAFGLGIDKADIRNIIQVGMPRGVEEYAQQIGRAGRDGKPAKCILYISPSDYTQRKNLEISGVPTRETVYKLLRDIFAVRCRGMEVGSILTLNQYDQVNNTWDKYKRLDAWTIEYVYAALELRFGLLRALSRKESPGEMRDESMSYLEQYGANARFRLTRLAPKDVNVSEVATDIWNEMQSRLDERVWRATQLMQLISSKRCLAHGLAEHFDMPLPVGTRKCMNCTPCLNLAKASVSLPEDFEQDSLTYSQLIASRAKDAVWSYSSAIELETDSDDSNGNNDRHAQEVDVGRGPVVM